ncbi:hypothetical protein ACX0HA_06010 [Flavobacterium hauense]
MDKFIKSVPLIITIGLLATVWKIGDAEYSNITAAVFCAAAVMMFISLAYIILDHFKQRLIRPGYYICLMLMAGLVTFAILYASLEYFYS